MKNWVEIKFPLAFVIGLGICLQHSVYVWKTQNKTKLKDSEGASATLSGFEGVRWRFPGLLEVGYVE